MKDICKTLFSMQFRARQAGAGLIALLVGVLLAGQASAITLNFDDLGTDAILTGTSYGGLAWEQGNVGVYGRYGYWVVPTSEGRHPHSLPKVLANGFGSTLIGITFPGAVNMAGTYITGDGPVDVSASTVRVHGYRDGVLVQTTPWLSPSRETAAWFDMTSLTKVDRIVFEAPPIWEGGAFYNIDDLTFAYIPEPASLAILTLTGAGLLGRRRRHK